jgi:predicted ATP-dependent endonuclease of OLD family
LALLNCKDGVLLLDEFETGLHYSVQEKLWDIIFMLSEKLKIQVFVTTHSNDCINSFVKSKINATVNGQVIRLEKQQDDICAKVFDDNDDLKFLTDNSIEIR